MTCLAWRRSSAALLAACLFAGPPARAQAPAASTPPAISAERLMTTVDILASEEYQGRASGTAGNAKARALIRARFEALRLRRVGRSLEQSFTFTPRGDRPRGVSAGDVTGVNVVGRCPGADPSRPAIVLSAHYDHLGIRDARLFPGADDNTSGTAAILELAAECMSRPFQRDLVVAAFDAEEGGLHGARAFVASALVPKDRIAVNVNLDMVARGDKGEIYVAGTRPYPELRRLLESVAAAAPIRVLFGHDLPGTGDEDWTLQSDHGEFHKVGVPFVYFGVEDHPDYHQPTDTPDKIDAVFFAKAVSVVLDALRALDAGLK
jgi:Zn-dependent M28 family amino/carboxypeptidase